MFGLSRIERKFFWKSITFVLFWSFFSVLLSAYRCIMWFYSKYNPDCSFFKRLNPVQSYRKKIAKIKKFIKNGEKMTKIEIDLIFFAQKPYREAFSMLFSIKLRF